MVGDRMDPTALSPQTLVGRAEECATLNKVVFDVREGFSGTVVFIGEPGVGKTRLLQYVRDSAAEVTTLWVSGAQSELRLGFAALHRLVRPYLVITQRVNYAKGSLDADRQRRLRDLPVWTWDARVDNWEQGFSRLQDYVELNGHARIPQPLVDGFPLGVWVGAQRRFRVKGTLEADREQRLGDLPGWTWNARADNWEQGFSRLREYVEHNGHSRVPVAYTIDGYPLGQWVVTQRHFPLQRHA
jgi:Helicase associated domain/AAA ATPase domain